MMLKILAKPIITLLLSGFCLTAYSQDYQPPVFPDENRLKKIEAAFPIIDEMFQKYAEENHFPAMVYGVVLDGELVHTFNAGIANIESEIPATSNSAFRIASMTKSITAMAILKLKDEGKLRLDDPIYLYVPEMKDIDYLTKDAPDITIRHLLNHASGFPEDNAWGDRQLDSSDDELLDIYNEGLYFSSIPGTGYEYSNLGYATLGLIIKEVSGQTYQNYIKENILESLGMKNTYWEYTEVPEDQLAHGYLWEENKWVDQPYLHDGAYGAMGGMISTVEDFSKYMAFHLSAWPPRNDVEAGPLKRSSLREMHHPWNLPSAHLNAKKTSGEPCPTVSAYGYGLGWIKDCENKVTIAHSGGLPGFGSQWRILPEYGIGIVSFANRTYANTGMANAQALDTLFALSDLQLRQLPPSEILKQRKEELVEILPNWESAQASGIFAENFFMDNFKEELKGEAEAAFERAGEITNISEVIPQNQLRGNFLMEGEKANIRIHFTLTPQNPPMIQAYNLQVLEKE
ncbi:serine hydrolase domain-containing protein [Christiangramia sp.]|uniref:serine hydrolase domain-containing protein n=1 Tax=Christiangramia sp. TaxID=1931228 RepID=UPI0026312422|nr:serine hydrolase domain-containing protein [Christiangramia sp.]